MSDLIAALRLALERLDGRSVTARDLAGMLGCQEREVLEALSVGRRRGWAQPAGKTLTGAVLYRRVALGSSAAAPDDG